MNTTLKLFSLFTTNQKRNFLKLLFLLTIGTFLEMFGIGLFLPLISLISNPEHIEKNILTKFIVGTFNFFNFNITDDSKFFKQDIFIYGISIIFIYYIFRSIYLLFLQFKQKHYLHVMYVHLRKKLFENYIGQKYTYYLNKNKSVYLQNLGNIKSLMNVFENILIFASELIITFGILTILLINEPKITSIILLIIFAIGAVFQFFSRSYLYNIGKIRNTYQKELYKTMIESFSSIREIKILNISNYFSKSFSNIDFKESFLTKNQKIVNSVPKILFETMFIAFVSLFLIYLMLAGKNFLSIFGTITIFVIASFRLIPSAIRILKTFNAFASFEAILKILVKEFEETGKNKESIENRSQKINFSKNIMVDNVSFSYDNKKYIFKDVSLKINKGEVVAIIGETGSGKSTLLDLFVGLLQPTSGKVLIDGGILSSSFYGWRENLSYVSQNVHLYDESIKKNIIVGENSSSVDNLFLNDVIKISELTSFVNSTKYGLETMIGENGVNLSGGQRQRIGIARALYGNKDVLIFDEVTSSLDKKTSDIILNNILQSKGKKTIIMVTHKIETLDRFDKIYKISNFNIIQEEKNF